MPVLSSSEFTAELAAIAEQAKALDKAMERLWKRSSRQQVALLDALPTFDHHDPMPFAKGALRLAEQVEASAMAAE